MKLEEYAEEVIIPFLRKYLEDSHCKGYVLGLSGGIDSALVSLLATKAVGIDKVFHLILPCYSHKDDVIFAEEFSKKFNLNYKINNLEEAYDAMNKNNQDFSKLSKANVKVRLRMLTLYMYAQELNSLVLGTDNWDERYVGYFTKFGDGAADLLPITRLTKSEVYQLSKLYGCTENILNRKPTAALWENQTDENELGFSYDLLDRYLLGDKNIDKSTIDKIERLHKISQHKRDNIPEAPEFIRK